MLTVYLLHYSVYMLAYVRDVINRLELFDMRGELPQRHGRHIRASVSPPTSVQIVTFTVLGLLNNLSLSRVLTNSHKSPHFSSSRFTSNGRVIMSNPRVETDSSLRLLSER